MRKSQAPSVLARQYGIKPAFKSPLLVPESERKSRKSNSNLENIAPPPKMSLSEHEEMIRKILSQPFKVPIKDYIPEYSNKTLGMAKTLIRRALHDPTIANALILYSPPEYTEAEKSKMNKMKMPVHVVVDPVAGNILRPHQREGVKFMYDCVTGLKSPDHLGCIMADEMGLGKTLQCITLVWTLLRQSPDCKAAIIKAVIVCPSSLVKNWYNEFGKWLGSRVNAMAIANESKEKTTEMLTTFMANRSARCGAPVLIISYETFRLYMHILTTSEVGLVLCDEGHRLKNCENQTYTALMGLKTKRRVLLTGTPIQNDMTEYFSLLHFVNPGLLGTREEFRRQYENVITRGQDANSTDKEREKSNERLAELKTIVDIYMIRRTSSLLTKYLPVKFEMVVCIKMTKCQIDIYKNFLESDFIRRQVQDGEKDKTKAAAPRALANIQSLKKLAGHPELVAQQINEGAEGFENAAKFLPSGWCSRDLKPEYGSKILVLDIMLAQIKSTSTDKMVLISNYTQTMDLFEKMCRKRQYNFVRLDGSMSIKKRGKIVEDFNKPDSDIFLFLLSSKAGGCGLNLIGANRLVMFDPDWNPANDEQAMARIWRDGQQKPCFIYRFLATGTIEEKIFQRQTHKKALSNKVVDNEKDGERHFSMGDLKDLFKLDENTVSDTHDIFKCKRCVNNIQIKPPPENSDCTSNLSSWYHCSNNKGIPDDILTDAWTKTKDISFVFHQRSATVEVPAEQQKKKKKDKKMFEYDDDDANFSEPENSSDEDYE